MIKRFIWILGFILLVSAAYGQQYYYCELIDDLPSFVIRIIREVGNGNLMHRDIAKKVVTTQQMPFKADRTDVFYYTYYNDKEVGVWWFYRSYSQVYREPTVIGDGRRGVKWGELYYRTITEFYFTRFIDRR